MKTVSIILPVYNVEAYLPKCLDSLLAQTYPQLEILLIDDGSTDRSLSILKSYERKDSRIHVYYQKNSGPSKARNLGLALCTGAYITFVDSDDWLEPTYIETLVKRIEHDGSDIAVCGHQIVYPKLRLKVAAKKAAVLTRRQALKMILEDKIIKNYAWGKLYDRKLLSYLYFPINEIYEDVKSIYKVFMHADKISLIAQPLYAYRMRKGSITYSLPANSAAEMKKAYIEQRKGVASAYPELVSCTTLNLLKADFLIAYTSVRDTIKKTLHSA